MKIFIHSIFPFLFGLCLLLFVNNELQAQWELILAEEGSNWNLESVEATNDGGLAILARVDDVYKLLRVDGFGRLYWSHSLENLNITSGTVINSLPFIQVLKDGGFLLIYSADDGRKLARLTSFGEVLWINSLDFRSTVFEMESGNYLQVVSVDTEDSELSQRDVVVTEISSGDGNIVWRKEYNSDANEEIRQKKKMSDGTYIVAGINEEKNVFMIHFDAEGDSIGGFVYDFEGEGIGNWETKDFYFGTLEITSDKGLVAVLSHRSSGNEEWFFPTIEKLNSEGISEWRKMYEPGENIEEDYWLYFLDNFRIRQQSNGNYLMGATHRLEWYHYPVWAEFTPTGEVLRVYSYELDHSFDNNWDLECGYGVDPIITESLNNGEYLMIGNGFDYNYSLNGCGYIPFVTSISSSGGIKQSKFYDLGNPEDYLFRHMGIVQNGNQGWFILSELTHSISLEKSIYIISPTSSSGESYDNRINGQIYIDVNENCEYENNDRTWSYEGSVINISTPENTYYVFTDVNGRFYTQLPKGDYSVFYNPTNELVEMTCEESAYTISFEENYDTLSNLDFAIKLIAECPKLEVEIGTPLLRRCFKNTYKINYCNKGTFDAENAQITLEFPEEMIPLESSISALEEGNYWTFNLGNVGIGECGSFTVLDSISCEADLGSTVCLYAHISPDEPCEPPHSLWDKSNIEVKGECIEEHVRFSLKNIGSGDMDEERSYYIYENDVLTESGKIQLKRNEKQQLYLNPKGRTLRLKVEQSPYFPNFNDKPQSIVEACGTGNFSFGYVNSVEQNDRYPSVDIDCQTITGSFDPNDIQVHPIGVTSEHLIEETTKLTYKIRFQNTGNDTAFRVMIVDTLPKELEGTTLNLGSSSHNYSFDILYGNLLVWTFDNILLPDSTTNERESHGFVQFSIFPKKGLELGTKIENKADIYFDFNAPVETNQVFNTITDDLEMDLGEPLAVYWIHFSAESIGDNKIQLECVTATEQNLSHIEVERSFNGIHFETVQMIEPKGGSEPSWYQVEDEYEGLENLLYYRLNAIDLQGNDDRTLIRTVLLENRPLKYQIWSENRQQILTEWIGEMDENYTLHLYNILGQKVLTQNIDWLRELLPHLESNVYVLQILNSQGKQIKTQKVFIP